MGHQHQDSISQWHLMKTLCDVDHLMLMCDASFQISTAVEVVGHELAE